MKSEQERLSIAQDWILGGGVDAGMTDVEPNYGPVWVSWHNPNYTPFTEKFETASHAADEMYRRCGDRYYPLWYDTEALVYGVDPDETGDAYPLVELRIRDDENGYTVVLNEG